MNADTRHSEPDSGTTSASTEKLKPDARDPHAAEAKPHKSEAQFLADEAAAARQAIDNTLANMRESLKNGVDVTAWTERYPWAAVGASAAAGFLVATALFPKRRGEEPAEPALLERILADEQITERIQKIVAEQDSRPSRGTSMLQSVGSSLLKTFGPALQSAIASALATRAAVNDVDEAAERQKNAAQEPSADDTPEPMPE